MKAYVVERSKLSDQVAARLEREIVRGERAVGDRLPSERELMRQFGVGRPAVREALFALQKKGLVQVSSGTRALITEPTPDILVAELSGAAGRMLESAGGERHFLEARRFFEVGLARFAARNATERDLARLEAALEANRAAIGDREAFEETDIEFHFVLAEIPRNPIFPALHQAMVEWLINQRHTTLRVPGQVETAYKAHERIYKSVAAGDPDRAERAMEAHLKQLYRVYEELRGEAAGTGR